MPLILIGPAHSHVTGPDPVSVVPDLVAHGLEVLGLLGREAAGQGGAVVGLGALGRRVEPAHSLVPDKLEAGALGIDPAVGTEGGWEIGKRSVVLARR